VKDTVKELFSPPTRLGPNNAGSSIDESLADIQFGNGSLSDATECGQIPRIVIVGAGFGGVAAAKALRRCNADIVLIDRRNHHIFQPLLYQVATAVLPASEIAAPIRQLAGHQDNISVMLAKVTGVDLKARFVDVFSPGLGAGRVDFDYLIVAPGAQGSYFGHDEFAKFAPNLKTLADAEAIRAKILSAFERAELTEDDVERARWMTFVLVGGGPTGVELAASIAQMASVTLRSNFRRIDPAKCSVFLIDGAKRILPTFAESLAAKATKRLEQLGVRTVIGGNVERIDDQGVIVAGKRIESATVIWTAGVAPSPLLKMLNAKADRAGRVCVDPFMKIPDHRNVFVIGDAASIMQDGRVLPGVAQVAIQQGRYVGKLISATIQGRAVPHPFRYFDKGDMATIGRKAAVARIAWPFHAHWSGFFAWVAWLVVHIYFLIGFRNRWSVFRNWAYTYIRLRDGVRLIVGSQVLPGWDSLLKETAPAATEAPVAEAAAARHP